MTTIPSGGSQEITPERIALATERQARATDINSYNLPELREEAALEVYDRLVEAERTFSPDLTRKGYRAGTASEPDELMVVQGVSPILMTAEHATAQRRRRNIRGKGNRQWRDSDAGTGALGLVVAQDSSTHLIVPKGRQTQDANHDIFHPLKDTIARVLESNPITTSLALHGMGIGIVGSLDDERSYDVMIGKGNAPTDESSQEAERIRELGKEFDMRVGINEPHIKMLNRLPPKPLYDKDGSMRFMTLAAAGEGTIRYFAEKHRQQSGRPLAALQLELSAYLRLLPADMERDLRKRQMGAYLGYRFLMECVSL